MLSFRAPGRVNLIGEHTDYTGGLVFPAAIHFSTTVDAEPLDGGRLIVASADFPAVGEFELADPEPLPRGDWTDYPRGVAVELTRAGFALRGARLQIRSDVPLGAGLSSSAALEVATGRALLGVAGLSCDPVQLAEICQRAENHFVGTKSGIMDQFASCLGKRHHAVRIDCRSLAYSYAPIPENWSIVIANTGVKHEHAGGEYNVRRAECEAGMQVLGKGLRDATLAELEAQRAAMPDVVYRRCRHVISENARVDALCQAFAAGDARRVGQLMDEAHRSIRDDFEASCPELDAMVGAAQEQDGLIGARMTGGGFGGCTVNLVEARLAAQFASRLAFRYEQITGIPCETYLTEASDGAFA